jgi:RNA polymerase sigma-70 factor (ECF subfamily)
MSEHGTSSAVASAEDLQLVAALRGGDERAFMMLVERYGPAMLRLALMYVPTRAIAEDVVQEAWLGVLNGLDGFQGRSSLRTWIFRILVNTAKTRGQRERRTVPFSSLWLPGSEAEPAVEPDRFHPEGDRSPNSWVKGQPPSWENVPEERLLSSETLERVRQAIDALPPNQREVIRLRDVAGWTSREVCEVLDISEINQRVLLHRARSKVRKALERYLNEEMATT